MPKEYPKNCALGGLDQIQLIMITNDESTFSANDGRQKVETLESHEILRPKSWEKGIIVLDFLLPWSRLNLSSLSSEKPKKLANLGISFEAVTYFEYRKIEEGYWIGEHLLDQVQKKALPIGEVLYPGYALLFLFDNATSHSVYTKNALRVGNMNKGSRRQ